MTCSNVSGWKDKMSHSLSNSQGYERHIQNRWMWIEEEFSRCEWICCVPCFQYYCTEFRSDHENHPNACSMQLQGVESEIDSIKKIKSPFTSIHCCIGHCYIVVLVQKLYFLRFLQLSVKLFRYILPGTP